MDHSTGRVLTFEIFRFDPSDDKSVPHMQTYKLDETPGMSIFIALNDLREKQDPSLNFDFVCRAGICGSCGMVINGVPDLACRTQTKNFESGKITLMPMPVFEMIGDLSVNTGKAMREMAEKLQTWVHDKRQDDVDLHRIEEKMDPDLADKIYELERCVECGVCLAGCGTKRMREDFLGAAGLLKVARYLLDPRDHRTEEDFYDVVATEDGVFGCMTLLGCEDLCPKDLPHQEQISYLRRKMLTIS